MAEPRRWQRRQARPVRLHGGRQWEERDDRRGLVVSGLPRFAARRFPHADGRAASVETSSLKNLAQSLKKMNSILGDGKKEITKSEVPIRKKLRIKIDN